MEDTSSKSDLDSSPIIFNHSDQELIIDYLLKKIKKEDLPNNKIADVDVFKHHPKSLTDNHPQWEKGIWYFVSPTDSNRSERKGDWGKWNVRGSKKKIPDDNGDIICERTSLDHFEKDGTKTDWTMFRYNVTNYQKQLLGEPEKLDDYVFCKITKRNYRKRAKVVAASTDENEDPPICDSNQAENSIGVQSEQEHEQVQVPVPDQPSNNQVDDLENLPSHNDTPVHNPTVIPPSNPLSPAQIDQFDPSNFQPDGTMDFNLTGPSYNSMTPPPHIDDDFGSIKSSDLDYFSDDDHNDDKIV